MKYLPLYIKTDNSLMESLISIKSLINKAKEYNINALTITDNNMYGVMDFYKECIKNNIKPVVGLELKYKNNIMVLYAMNYLGYRNLIKINTIISTKNIELSELEKYSSDLICLVPFNSISIYNDIRGLYKYIFKTYRNKDEMDNLTGDLIYMNETLYLNKEDNKYIKYWTSIKEGSPVDIVSNDKLHNYLMTYEETLNMGNINNNELIYDLCNLEIPINQNLMPEFKNEDGLDSYSYLKKKCIEGLKSKFGTSIGTKYQERLKYELDVINKMGFSDYFLIVYDIIKYAKEHNIIVGPGRGSAVGSLVAYCLDIIEVDPLKYDLIFGRFLNIERISMPDIDIDFENTKREEMIEYCISKYGEKSVAPIIAFSTMGARQALKDVGRSMEIDLPIVDGLCKLIDQKLSLKENYQNEKVRTYISRYDKLDELYKIAYKFEGLKRQTTIHAAGIVLSKGELDDVIPLDKKHPLFYTSGYDMTYLEEIGLLKIDFLAIKNLTLIHNIIDDINKEYNTNLTFSTIPFNNAKAIEIFTKANTLGIFQFEKDGMIDFLSKLKPTTFNEIVAAIALYRPGPMASIPSYIRRKNKQERIDYYDESLIPVLKDTYGIMVYQEQIMKISNIMANFSLGEADILRKAMGKKKKELLLEIGHKFKENSIKNGYNEELVDKVYNLMLKFAEYAFNKSHSVGYALVSYRMAYLKAIYPEIFMSHMLTEDKDDNLKLKKYIYECKKNNIEIYRPNINYSIDKFVKQESGIRFPLNAIKEIRTNIVDYIVSERNNNGKYKDIFDFIKRCYGKVVNRNILENLIYADVFSDFEYNRATLIHNLDSIINYGELIKDLDIEYALKPEINKIDEFDEKFIMEKELKLFGIYLNNHPVSKIKAKYNNIVELSNIELYFDKNIDTVIYVDKIKEINTKKNDKMAFITASDEFTSIDVILFPRLYKEYSNINNGDILYINAKVEKRYDKYQLIVNRINKVGE